MTRSDLVKAEGDAKKLAVFLKVGRPDKGMPAFNLDLEQVTQIAAFLHSAINSALAQRTFGDEVLVGDPKAGKAFFHGNGQCARCHSETGDLRHIGAKYTPAVLQGRLVLPIGDGGYPRLSSQAEPPRIRVKLTQPNGTSISGLLIFLSDYAVTIIDSAGERRTIPRQENAPLIELEDPLQAHFDLQATLADKEMHNLTAYLATLK